MAEQNLYCGVHIAYITLGLLGEKTRSVEEVFSAFPDAKEKGVSFDELITFFEKKNLFCETRDMTEEEILRGGSDVIYIVLKEQVKTIAHFVLKRKSAENELQIFDTLRLQTVSVPPEKADKKEYYTLLVSRKSFSFLSLKKVLCALSFVTLLLTIFYLFHKRNREDVYLTNKKLDFGNFIGKNGGMSVEKIIGVVNNTNAPIEIKDVITTCDCMRYDNSRRTIPPKSKLDMTFEMKLSPTSFPGKKVEITLSLSNNKELSFLCEGRMTTGFYTYPEKIEFSSSQIKTLYVSVRDYDKDISIAQIKSSSSEVKIERAEETRRELGLIESKRLYFYGAEYRLKYTPPANKDLSISQNKTPNTITIILTNGRSLEIPFKTP